MLLKANFEQFRPHCSPKLTSGGIVDPSNAAALHFMSFIWIQRWDFHCASGRLWPNWVMAHSLLHAAQGKF
jgi:hypothetical protein